MKELFKDYDVHIIECDRFVIDTNSYESVGIMSKINHYNIIHIYLNKNGTICCCSYNKLNINQPNSLDKIRKIVLKRIGL
jgi:hypothetical protein